LGAQRKQGEASALFILFCACREARACSSHEFNDVSVNTNHLTELLKIRRVIRCDECKRQRSGPSGALSEFKGRGRDFLP
jgi:hypothetical protein